MVLRDFRDFLAEVERRGDMKLVEGADCDLEIGTLTEIMCEQAGPMLLFDRIIGYPKGYRIGYGGGFYYRFLPKCPQAKWIGLAYEAQITEDTFPEVWDVPLHQTFTENGGVILENDKIDKCGAGLHPK